jgi:serine/threonine-protein kinase
VATCPSCSQQVPADARFCGHCGGPLPPSSEIATRLDARERRSSSAAGSSEGRFLPGTVLADRYRIVGLLGKGGMGEVYRADDLKLGQAVALKFLPHGLEQEPGRLDRFLNEVRTARQVSHSNVCRVYDVGEVDGHHFLSMEYVDGEDLASLLRRIGRLPRDKAIELSRQLAAGLATAHDAGVLHRDLKPANIMIDGRGRARITDFGLAGLAGEIHGEEVRSGTPAYMAPEQLDGREVTVRSDIYSLGLVLYELFTGKPPFRAGTSSERRRMQARTTPASPSSFVEGFDPAVERLLLRCLDPDPGRRPRSALAVAAALPGGDPLAAAVAAGETPSPEMVAEAGAAGGLRPAAALGLLAGFAALMAVAILLGDRVAPLRRVPLPKPPQVLEEKAREILASVGQDGEPRDSIWAFQPHEQYLDALGQDDSPDPARLAATQPSALRFFYRQSPFPLTTQSPGTLGDWMTNPPHDRPGMAMVGLDTSGRLVLLEVVPPERDEGTGGRAGGPDWSVLFVAAGLKPDDFVPVAPEWTPPAYADAHAAWEGVYPDAPEIPIRLEAASYRGKPTAFRVIEPWTRAAAITEQENPVAWLTGAWYLAVLLGAGFMAWRNIRLGRGDRRTALRLALYLGCVRLLWILGAHNLASGTLVAALRGHMAWSLYRVGVIYVFYLALEPYARRLWPKMLTSWVRLLGGRFRDPLVGRDLLLGSLMGAMLFAAQVLGALADPQTITLSSFWLGESLRGLRHAATAIVAIHTQSVLQELFMPVTMFLIVRLLLRRTWAAILVVSALALLLFSGGEGVSVGLLVTAGTGLTVFWLTFLRLGLLPLVVALTFGNLLQDLPLTPELGGWHATATWLCLVVTVGIALYGFRASLAGRSLLGEELAEARAPAA